MLSTVPMSSTLRENEKLDADGEAEPTIAS